MNQVEQTYQQIIDKLKAKNRQQQAEISNLKAGLLSHHDIHPVKELTDEEIIQTYADIEGKGIIEFAKAILRKAQEK